MTNLKPTSMASKNLLPLLLPLLTTLFIRTFPSDSSPESPLSILMYPFNCVDHINTCSSILYSNNGLPKEQIASFYSVSASQIKPISHANKQDYLVTVPCSCKNVNGTRGYFYETFYRVRPNNTFFDVSHQIYSGQAWEVGGEERNFTVGNEVSINLLCGCIKTDSQIVVTYTVQQSDTLSDIATLLSANMSDIESMNRILITDPDNIDLGWVLYVPMPMGKNGVSTGRGHKWTIIIGVLSAVTLLSMCTLAIILLRIKRSRKNSLENPKATVSKSLRSNKSLSLQNQYQYKENTEGQTQIDTVNLVVSDMSVFESEKPGIYSLEELEEATCNFDETRKIGEGGYGSVYFGVIRDQEVAIKKMKSNKSKEFFAEIKVLIKIHHINVVELLGYASGDDHLYLVYEFIQNGSLSDHLHDPLLKARTQIALDAAKGIEYIHDHTKARYVHRDIKTSNILLDEGLRAKVADFGLAKLVGRTNEDDFIATRLVGTPGYLPPESVKELLVTTKTDVFAFGVVLAELITGQRALIRDNRTANKTKSIITVVNNVFQDEDPETALDSIIDGNLKGNYPLENVYKMAEISEWCLSEDAVDRPEMREVVVALSQIMMSSIEWEASLGGNSQVFSGVFSGR
ncbi:hypothetical protein F0562_034285 [Nyssa sinensis]|uniref:Protein kinase domain-containing protein n=1 Tax=Nyssa sinensis TaxID=561372 RepID=A0A5J5AEX9_9ASTE|nr:hypothetical protein F0562_034285 [Nyssa sinensis]